jgi:hypothetical protein
MASQPPARPENIEVDANAVIDELVRMNGVLVKDLAMARANCATSHVPKPQQSPSLRTP